MQVEDGGTDLWSLSSEELASQCLKITEQAPIGTPLQDEARRLYLDWREVLTETAGFGDRSRRAVMAAGLRRRTIQILAKQGLRD